MIRVGSFDIRGAPVPPDARTWNKAGYELAVQRYLRDIRKTETGRAVEAAIGKETVRIRPEESVKVENAHVDPGDKTTIRYTPGLYAQGYVLCITSPRNINHKPDEVLLDEMVNAMLRVTGYKKQAQAAVSKIDYNPAEKNPSKRFLFFHKEVEFHSITIVNVYVSEKNKKNLIFSRPQFDPAAPLRRDGPMMYVLRKDHAAEHSHVPLAAPEAFSGHPRIRPMVESLCNALPALCHEIALVPAAFNPYRDVLIDRSPHKLLVELFRKYDGARRGERELEFFKIASARLKALLGKEFDVLAARFGGP